MPSPARSGGMLDVYTGLSVHGSVQLRALATRPGAAEARPVRFLVTWHEPDGEERVEEVVAVDAEQARRLVGQRLMPRDPVAGEQLVLAVQCDSDAAVEVDPGHQEAGSSDVGRVIDDRALYTVDQVADLMECSRRQVYNLFNLGLKYSQMGRARQVLGADLLTFRKARRRGR